MAKRGGRRKERNQHPGNVIHNRAYVERRDQQWTKGTSCSCAVFSSSSSYLAKWLLMFRLITVPLHMSVGLLSNSSQACLVTDKGGVWLARKGEEREDHSHQQETTSNLLEEERDVMKFLKFLGKTFKKKKKLRSSGVDQSQVWWLHRGRARRNALNISVYSSDRDLML